MLLARACANLTNLHTLRIIFGHWNITKGLLAAILNKSRISNKPLRRLWLESCSITGFTAQTLSAFNLDGLESLRIRRLQLLSFGGKPPKQHVYARGRSSQALQDGKGGLYNTTTEQSGYIEGAMTGFLFHRALSNYPYVCSLSASAVHR